MRRGICRILLWAVALAGVVSGLSAASARSAPAETQVAPRQQPARKIVVGGDQAYPPYEYLDSGGRPAGFHVELMEALAEEQGFELEYRLGPWAEVLESFKSGQIDTIALFRSRQREAVMTFSEPHAILHYLIFYRRGDEAMESLSDLPGRQVIVQRGSHIHEMLEEAGFAVDLVLVDSEPEATSLLASGEHDCAVVTEVGGLGAIRRLGLDGAILASPPVFPQDYCFAVMKGREPLLDQINAGLRRLRQSGRYAELQGKWLAQPDGQPLTFWQAIRYVGWVVGLLGAVAGVMLAWSWSLRRQVARRTSQLRDELAQRRRVESLLHQSQKMEAVGRLAGGVAHDFRNQLTVVKGYAELLRTTGLVHQEGVQHVKEILTSVRRSEELTSRLLTFSRTEKYNPRPVDLGGFVEDVCKDVRTLLNKGIVVEQLIDPAAGMVEVDAGQLHQAVLNLAVNARDAMPDGGRLTIEVAAVNLDKEFVRLHPGSSPGPHAVLSVADTGTGMDQRTAERVFEPFFTTKPMGKGTGLGLFMVYGFVKNSGGYIDVESRPGEGTIFRLYLPRLADRAGDFPSGEVAAEARPPDAG